MEKDNILEEDDKHMSWDEFKEKYLPKVEYLAKIVGLPRDYKSWKEATIVYEDDIEECRMDDDHDFVDYVMRCILDWEGKYVTTPLLYCLRETDGAEEIFDEVYRIWAFRFCRGDELLFLRRPIGRGTRSEPGRGDIIDIFLMKREDGETLLNHGFGEDFADCRWPVAVKVKHKSCMSNEELTKGLRDLADALEAGFKNCYFPSSDGYIVPNSKEEQAILCGLYENNPELHQDVKWNPGVSLDQITKMAGWIHPHVSLNTGLGKMLQGGWPELYERALSREITPFEALLETGCVGPRTVYEVLTSNGEPHDVGGRAEHLSLR